MLFIFIRRNIFTDYLFNVLIVLELSLTATTTYTHKRMCVWKLYVHATDMDMIDSGVYSAMKGEFSINEVVVEYVTDHGWLWIGRDFLLRSLPGVSGVLYTYTHDLGEYERQTYTHGRGLYVRLRPTASRPGDENSWKPY